MAVIKRLDGTGHTETPVDPNSTKSMEEARRLIESAFEEKALVHDTSVRPGEPIKRAKDYDPKTMPDVTITPMFVGG